MRFEDSSGGTELLEVESGYTVIVNEDGTTREVFLKRGAGMLGFVSLSTLLEACGSSGGTNPTEAGHGTPPSKPTGTLRIAMAGYPPSVDPTIDGSVSTTSVFFNIYEGLVGFNADYSKLVGVLASGWEVSDSARVWKFKLRQGVKFHDGSAFDSTAARKSIEFCLRKEAAFGPYLLGTPTLDDSDPGVLVFRYKEPQPDLARNLTFAAPIFSPKLLQGGIAAAAKRVLKEHVGTGPFRFTGGQEGQSITLAAFAGYWGEKPRLAELQYSNIADESARVSALQAGDVDLVLQLSPLAARSLKSDPRLTVHAAPTWTTVVLMPASHSKPFNDVRVRQALTYAIDRNALVEKVLLGDATLDTSMLPQGVYGYSQPSIAYPYNQAKARELLKAAGYSGKVPVRIATRSDAVLASEITQAIVSQLNEVGFQATGDVLDGATYEADLSLPNPKYDIHWEEDGWVNGGPFHITLGDVAAGAQYDTKPYAALVAKVASAVPDGPERLRLIAETVDTWAKEAGWVNLWVPKRLDASIAGLQDYTTPPNVLTLIGGAFLASS